MPVEPAGAESIRAAAAILRAGGLVAFPTETVYGLGADALDPAAVAGIYAAKGRPATNPVIVHVLGADATRRLVAEWPERAARLAEAFWPGPLTLVLAKSHLVPEIVTAGGPTVALRSPAHPVARALLEACGLPLAAPSANRSGMLSPTTAAHVESSLGERVPMILDGGPCAGGIESTVLDLTGPAARVLRPGLVGVAELAAVLGEAVGLGAAHGGAGPLMSPGLLASHYAPRTPLYLGESEAECHAHMARHPGAVWYSYPDDPASVARHLYEVLHEFDADSYPAIVMLLPPNRPEWAAIRDRLRRAAARL